METAARRVEMTGRTIARTGREITQAISLPLIAAGFLAFRAALDESHKSFGPLFTLFQAFRAEVHDLWVAIGQALTPVFEQLIGLFRSGIAHLQTWVAAFNRLSPGMKQVITYTLLFLAALGPTVLIIGKVITAVGALIKILPLLVTSTGLATIAIGALAGAALLTVTHWDWAKY